MRLLDLTPLTEQNESQLEREKRFGSATVEKTEQGELCFHFDGKSILVEQVMAALLKK